MSKMTPKIAPKYTDTIQFQSRNYIRVGTNGTDLTYRGVIFLSPQNQIQSVLSTSSKGISAGYSILNAELSLTAMSGSSNIPVRAFMLPLKTNTDQTISWLKPSSSTTEYFDNPGGDIEPLSENIVCYGQWNGNKVSFNITPYANIWNGTTAEKLGLVIAHEETVTGFETFFYSSESTTPLIGGSALSNCRFLSAGDTNSISTEGVRIRMVPYGSNVSVELVDSSEKGKMYWSAFNAAIATGKTFSIRLPDATDIPTFSENDPTANNGYIFTVVDKLSADGIPSIIVDEYASVVSNRFYSTAEFVCTSTLPSGTGILEFTNPNDRLVTDLSALRHNDPLYINYTPTSAANNARSYTLNLYSNETLLNNRVRLYLNEPAVSENRNGLYTEIKTQSVQPTLKIDIGIVPFSER